MNWSDTKEYKALRARWYLMIERYPDHTWRCFSEWYQAIGKPPARNYTLRKLIPDKPLGPDNWQWVKWVNPSKKPNIWNTKTKAGKSAYDKHLRQVDPDRERRFPMLRKYGLTVEQYEQMLTNQGGVCGSCKRPETLYKQGKLMRLNVDHGHVTGRIRGLLCTRCNRGIGLLGDTLEGLLAAVEYLESQTVSAGISSDADFRRQREMRLLPVTRRNVEG